MIVHAFSTQCNVDLLTEEQCRVELKRTNEELLDKDFMIVSLKEQINSVSKVLLTLTHLHQEGRSEDVQRELDRLARVCQQHQQSKQTGGVH